MGPIELENLVRIGQLKAEPRKATECARLLVMAETRLKDAKLPNLSLEGRFTSAYYAARPSVNRNPSTAPLRKA
jgi:hypothetical protein